MDLRHSKSEFVQSKSFLSNSKYILDLILKIAKLPFVCDHCGHISRMKEFSELLENDGLRSLELDNLNERLLQKAQEIMIARQKQVDKARQSIQQSIQQLMDVRQSLSSLNLDDPEKCLDTVCDHILGNIQQTHDLTSALNELDQLIQQQESQIYDQDFDKAEYLANLDLKQKFEGALRINLNQRQIEKDVLLKLAEENKHSSCDLQLQYYQQQLETLNLLKQTQEQMTIISKLEEELNDKKMELSKYSVLVSNIDNPFKQNKLHSYDEESSQFQSIQKELQSTLHNHQSRGVLQELKNTQSKKTSQTENLCTFQSDHFYSFEQNNSPYQQKNNSQKSSQNSKQFENSQSISQRYGNSISNKINNLQALNIISQMNTAPLPNRNDHKSNQLKSSLDTNPLASQDSMEDDMDDENSNGQQDIDSPRITPSSKTLLSQVPVLKKGNVLIIE